MISENFPGPTPEEQIAGIIPDGEMPAETKPVEPSMQWEKDANGEDVLVTDIEKYDPGEDVPTN